MFFHQQFAGESGPSGTAVGQRISAELKKTGQADLVEARDKEMVTPV